MYLGCFHRLVIVNNAVMNMIVQVFPETPAFNSLATCPKVELWSHMVVLCLTFGETAKLFSIVAELFYIPISNVQGF